jgi:hypothetical protein
MLTLIESISAMMIARFSLVFSTLFLFVFQASSQRIVYSEPGKDDTRRMNFEIIGKVGGNFLVYKDIRNKTFISVYDNDMKMIANEEHEYLPEDRIINVDFFPYDDHTYMVYQYQRRNVVYCKAVTIDPMGKKISPEMELDTTHLGFSANNKIYTVISSEDKKQVEIYSYHHSS